jgi:hypothetical protein
MKRTSLLLSASLALGSALGCGPEFNPSSEVTTLRVMGVKKDKPYAQPGEQVSLKLLWHDPKGRTDVQRAFIGGCVNPLGDLYYGCFESFQRLQASGDTPPIGLGDDFTITLPGDIISGRPGPFEPGQPRYGLYIVFFAVCAGQLDFVMGEPSDGAAVPVRCLDPDGKPLGSEDFIVGYSSVYSFDGVSNANPDFAVDSEGAGDFLVAGKTVPADCVGSDCQGKPPVEVDCEQQPERCIAPCGDDGDTSCPAIEVAPHIDPSVVERDDVSSDLFDSEVTEQQWINYYVDHGSISEARLLNDSTTGWNSKYRGQLRAPQDAGLLQVWAVSHDNRGGMDFARVTLRVTE